MIEDVVADARTYLAQVDRQMKEEEEEHLLKDVKKSLLKKDDKAVVINDNLEEVAGEEQRNFAEGKEDWKAATSIVTARATCFIEDVGNNQWTEDILDKEIEMIRRLMVKTSQKKTAERKKRSDNKRVTAKDCKSRESGALQHKIWKPGRQQQMTTVVKQSTSTERLQNKILDPGGNIQTYDQVVMNFLTWGV